MDTGAVKDVEGEGHTRIVVDHPIQLFKSCRQISIQLMKFCQTSKCILINIRYVVVRQVAVKVED